jgi:hypothetical protein
MRLVAGRSGKGCSTTWYRVEVRDIQADEICAYVAMKEKPRVKKGDHR